MEELMLCEPENCKKVLAKDPFNLFEPPYDVCSNCEDAPEVGKKLATAFHDLKFGSFSKKNNQQNQSDNLSGK
jgi:hypothetical protein